MIVELFTEPLHRRYFASRLSIAYLFALLCKITLIFLPFLLSYRNGKIWLKYDKYLEQAEIQYTYKMILVLQTTLNNNGTSSKVIPNEIFYSTIPNLNILHSNNLRVPIMRSREVDDTLDGVMDYFWLNALIPLLPDEYVYEIQAILIFNYKIKKEINLEFDSIAYIHHTSGIPSSSLYSIGQFNIKQTGPLMYREILQRNDHELLSLDDDTILNSIKESNVNTLLEKASKQKKYVTKYEELYVTSQRAFSSEDKQQYYNLTLHIDIPTHQEILRKPGIIEVLYYAWIRYISLFIVIGYLMHKICSFVFYYQIVSTTTKIDAIKEMDEAMY